MNRNDKERSPMMKKVITLFMGLILRIGCQKEETTIIDNQNPITIEYQDYKVDILEGVQNYEIRSYSSYEASFIKAPADSIFVDVVASVFTDKESDEKIWLQDMEYSFNNSDIKPYGIYMEV